MSDLRASLTTKIPVAVAAVLVIALLARIVPVEYGKPGPAAFASDEVDTVSRALKFASGDLMPIHFSKPTFHVAVVAAAIGADHLARRIVAGETLDQLERRFFLAPFPFYRVARLVSLAASLATLALLLLTLRRLGPGAMLVGTVILGLGVSSAYFAHVAKEDALCAMLVFASYLAACRALRLPDNSSRPWLAASAICAGLAVSTKYNCFFAAAYPVLAITWSPLRRGLASLALVTVIGITAFAAGTPFAALHPQAFVTGTLDSAVASQITGTFHYVHNIGKMGPQFVPRMLWREFGPALLAIIPAALLLRPFISSRRAWLFAIPPALYLIALVLSRQLDYQYAILLTPLAATAAARLFARQLPLSSQPWPHRAGVAAILIGGAWNLHIIAPETAAYAGKDTRVQALEWIDQYWHTLPEPLAGKPLLFATPFYFRYYPPVHLDAGSYSILLAETRDAGGEGGYFERAMRWAAADTESTYPVRFLPISASFHLLPDGTRQFATQPFSLNPEDYRGRYSLVVIPSNTRRLTRDDLPELDNLRTLLRYLAQSPPLVTFRAERWLSAGPEIRIFEAP